MNNTRTATTEREVATMFQGEQVVNIVEQEGSPAYLFLAVGEISLPFAVRLAVFQTSRGRSAVDRLIKSGVW